ncbi:MAG: hypothetical protein OEZ13_02500 [Spirochaetia bacterium]|nr:hypothetical protein [Spirochaetia bacterium]
MKNILILNLLFFLSSLMITPLWAESSGAFLRHGLGAKAMGLGKAYQTVVKDPGALYWNPAGLANINGQAKISDSLENEENEDPFGDTKTNQLLNSEGQKEESPKETQPELPSVERPFEMQFYNAVSQLTFDRQAGFSALAFTAVGGTIGFGLLGFYTNDIEGYNEIGESTGSITYQTMAAYLGYAFESGATRAGFSLTGINEKIADKSLNGASLNVGIQLMPLPILEFGANIQNLAGVIQEHAGSDAKYERLDTILSASIGIRTLPPKSSLLVLLGFEANLDTLESEDLNANFGLAYSINRYSYVMAGLNTNGLSCGFGMSLSFFQIAYAINQDRLKTGIQHHFDINFLF